MLGEERLRGRHGELELALALGFADDGEAVVPGQGVAEALDAVDGRAGFGMFQKQDVRVIGMREQVLGAAAARRVVVGFDGGRDELAVLHVRVNRDDGDVRGVRDFKRGAHALPVDGIEENQRDALVDEVFHFLGLPLNGERRIARNQHVAVVFDGRADFFVDDFVERVRARHVDGADLAAGLVLAGGKVVVDEGGRAREKKEQNSCNCNIPKSSFV